MLVHELGHFFTALSRGIRPNVLSIGFGPALLRRERHGIVYQVCLLPLGGFVLFDHPMDETPRPRCLTRAPLGTQALVMVAGIVVQAVLAFGLVGAAFGIWGVPRAMLPTHAAQATGLTRKVPFVAREALAFEAVSDTLSSEVSSMASLVTGHVSLTRVQGPVGVLRITSRVLAMGPVQAVLWTAVLSLDLGIMNSLPFPGFDGGQLLALGVAALRRGRRNFRLEAHIQTAGLFVILAFTGLITVLNLWKG